MLTVYDDRRAFPSDKKYIRDVEAWFVAPEKTTKEIDLITPYKIKLKDPYK